MEVLTFGHSVKTRETQQATRTRIPCPNCDGTGKRGFIFTCGLCHGDGQMILITVPDGRVRCPDCRGRGTESTLLEEAVCVLCHGSGLDPLPADHPCPSCSGLGFHTFSVGGVIRMREGCNICRGSGTQAKPRSSLRQCPDCKGHGYSLTLGPGSRCYYCEGSGWVPQQKPKPR